MLIASWLLVTPMMLAAPQTSMTRPETTGAVRHVVVSGEGRAPSRAKGAQARLMAKRAAEVTALRNLAHELQLATPSTISGFRYVSATYHPDGRVTVVVEWRGAVR